MIIYKDAAKALCKLSQKQIHKKITNYLYIYEIHVRESTNLWAWRNMGMLHCCLLSVGVRVSNALQPAGQLEGKKTHDRHLLYFFWCTWNVNKQLKKYGNIIFYLDYLTPLGVGVELTTCSVAVNDRLREYLLPLWEPSWGLQAIQSPHHPLTGSAGRQGTAYPIPSMISSLSDLAWWAAWMASI